MLTSSHLQRLVAQAEVEDRRRSAAREAITRAARTGLAPTRRMVTLATSLAATAGAAALLSACAGNAVIDPSATAKTVSDFVYHHTGLRPVDVRCPSGVPATTGRRLKCHFTGPEGPYTAYVRIMSVHGRRAVDQIETQPSSWPAPTLG